MFDCEHVKTILQRPQVHRAEDQAFLSGLLPFCVNHKRNSSLSAKRSQSAPVQVLNGNNRSGIQLVAGAKDSETTQGTNYTLQDGFVPKVDNNAWLSSTELDDLENIMAFSSSFALSPLPMLQMIRRLSHFNDACESGVRYLEESHWFLSLENYYRPRSLLHRSFTDLEAPADSHDPAVIAANPLVDLYNDIGVKDPHVAYSVGQRYFLGGDRFPQNYTLAKLILQSASAVSEPGQSTAFGADALTMIGTLMFLGLGVEEKHRDPTRDKALASRIFHLASQELQNPLAASNLAVAILDMNARDFHMNDSDSNVSEARRLLRKAADPPVKSTQADARSAQTQGPAPSVPGAANSVALDLMTNHPLRMGTVMNLGRGNIRAIPQVTEILAKIAVSEDYGLQSCTQAWNLLSKNIRRDLWYQAAQHALDSSPKQSVKLSSTELALLASAGVENAEYALLRRVGIPKRQSRIALPGAEDVSLKKGSTRGVQELEAVGIVGALRGGDWGQFEGGDGYPGLFRAMVFSAHRGRAESQLRMASEFEHSEQRLKRLQIERPSLKVDEVLSVEEEVNMFEEWNMFKTLAMDRHELARYTLDELAKQRGRWGTPEDPVSPVDAIAEALTHLAWFSFFGKGGDQNLRDALMYIQQMTTASTSLWTMQWAYWAIVQSLVFVNYLALNWTSQETLSTCLVVSVVVGALWFRRKILH